MLIKICGVTDPETAHFATSHGAHFVGLVFDEDSPRYIDMSMAKEVRLAAEEGGGTAVSVFRLQNGKEMLQTLEELNLLFVQLHGDLPRKEHSLLPEIYHRIFSVPVPSHAQPHALDQKRDFLLYDAPNPGKGKPFEWKGFAPSADMPYFVAGGLTPENVNAAIKALHPKGVDVSSGVETDGKKDKAKIKRFIDACQTV